MSIISYSTNSFWVPSVGQLLIRQTCVDTEATAVCTLPSRMPSVSRKTHVDPRHGGEGGGRGKQGWQELHSPSPASLTAVTGAFGVTARPGTVSGDLWTLTHVSPTTTLTGGAFTLCG